MKFLILNLLFMGAAAVAAPEWGHLIQLEATIKQGDVELKIPGIIMPDGDTSSWTRKFEGQEYYWDITAKSNPKGEIEVTVDVGVVNPDGARKSHNTLDFPIKDGEAESGARHALGGDGYCRSIKYFVKVTRR